MPRTTKAPPAGPVEVNRKIKRVAINGVPIELRPKEYLLIEFMLRDPNKLVSYKEIAKALFRKSELVRRTTLEAIADATRERLKAEGAGPGYLAMVWGAGFVGYQPPETITVRTFHVPSAHFESSGNGRISPPADMVEPTWEGEVEVKLDDQRICDTVYDALNRDDRPNGHFAPALSQGDIVTLRVNSDDAKSYEVASIGFMPLDNPVFGTDEGVDELMEQLDKSALAF